MGSTEGFIEINDVDMAEQLTLDHTIVEIALCASDESSSDAYLTGLQVTYGIVNTQSNQISDRLSGPQHGQPVDYHVCKTLDTSASSLDSFTYSSDSDGIRYLAIAL